MAMFFLFSLVSFLCEPLRFGFCAQASGLFRSKIQGFLFGALALRLHCNLPLSFLLSVYACGVGLGSAALGGTGLCRRKPCDDSWRKGRGGQLVCFRGGGCSLCVLNRDGLCFKRRRLFQGWRGLFRHAH